MADDKPLAVVRAGIRRITHSGGQATVAKAGRGSEVVTSPQQLFVTMRIETDDVPALNRMLEGPNGWAMLQVRFERLDPEIWAPPESDADQERLVVDEKDETTQLFEMWDRVVGKMTASES